MTSASGTYTFCGFGQPFALEFTCTGLNCDYLDGFPGTSCTSDGTTLTCTNGVVCPTSSNYTSTFTLDQPLSAITQNTKIFLGDACTNVEASNNGTGSGVNVVSMPIADCTPVIGSSAVSSSTTSTTATTSSVASSSTTSTLSSTPSSSSTVSSTSSTTSTSSTSGSSSSTSPTTSSSSSSESSSTSSPTSSASEKSGTSETPSTLPLTSSSAKVPSTSGSSTTLSGATTESSAPFSEESSVSTSGSSPATAGISSALPTSQPHAPSRAKSNTESVTCCETSEPAPSSAAESPPGNAETTSRPASNTSLPSNVESNAAAASSSETLPAAASESAAANSTLTLSRAASVGFTGSPSQPTSSGPAQVYSSNARAWREPSLMTMCYLIFAIFALFQPTMALDITTVNAIDARSVGMELTLNDTSPNPAFGELLRRGEGSLGKQFTDLIAEYVAGKITNPELAETFVAEIYSAICSHFAGLALTTGVFAEVGQFVEYATLAFDTIALPTGPAGWLIAFSFTVALNVLVSEMFPQIDQIVSQACEQPKPCSEDFANDAENCGRCGNMCTSGVCKNSACVSNTCTGETCETFTTCGPGGSCVCASTAEGTGFCVDGSTPCAGLQTCTTSGDCPAGEICGVASCCEINVCVGATFCGGADAAKFLFRKELYGPTFGRLY